MFDLQMGRLYKSKYDSSFYVYTLERDKQLKTLIKVIRIETEASDIQNEVDNFNIGNVINTFELIDDF